MASSVAGPSNGVNGHHVYDDAPAVATADPRRTLEIPTLSNEFIPIDLDCMFEEADTPEAALDEIANVLESERAPVRFWVRLIEEVWRVDKWASAFDLISRAVRTLKDTRDHVPLLCMRATYNMALARQAPRQILFNPKAGKRLTRSDKPNHPESKSGPADAPPELKNSYWAAAETALLDAERIDRQDRRIRDIRLTFALARGRMDDAVRLSDAILADEPTNLTALMARARTLFAKRAFRPALRNYQQVLALRPEYLPDPRIGIGLCYWMTGEKDKAKKAWERSAAINPDSQGTTLLALAHLNAAQDPAHAGGNEGRVVDFEIGIKLCEGIFKRDNTSAIAAGALGSLFLKKGNFNAALKLAERMVQFADARILESEAHLLVARVLHSSNTRENFDAAVDSYSAALRVNADNLPAKLAAIQAAFKRTHVAPETTRVLEDLIRRQPRCVEALAMLAAVSTQRAFSLASYDDSLAERRKAKAFYEQILGILNISRDAQSAESELHRRLAASERIAQASRMPELFVDIAKLWSDEPNSIKALQGYREAVRIQTEDKGAARPELINNVGVLEYHRKEYDQAAARFEEAVTAAAALLQKQGTTEDLDAILTTATYNIGVAAEATGETDKATGAYNQILTRHPEYVDAKARLALLAISKKDYETAHNYLKEALTAKSDDCDLRALYAYYLYITSPPKMARDFCISTLKDISRHDLYSLQATGIIAYNLIRDDKNNSKEAIKGRPERYAKAAEFFDKALQLDPSCARAAQGLAVFIAEGNLGTGVEVTATQAALSDGAARAKNARDALSIFMKVRESVNDASVYVNIGHCHFVREEYELAIENYAAASRRYLQDKDVTVLLYLARAWYAKASKELKYSDIVSALEVARKALAISPDDLSVQYNIALIEQKGCEIIFDLQPSQRTLAELDQATADGEDSVKIFERLANEPQERLPLAREFVSQRAKYGQNVARRAPEARAAQVDYEDTEQAKIQRAKQAREEERAKREAAEAERREQIRLQAEALAEHRRKMREEAAQWIAAAKAYDSDDDDKKKQRKKRSKPKREDGLIESEDDDEGETEKPAKKKTKKAKKAARPRAASRGASGGSGAEAGGDGKTMDVDSDEEEVVKPSKSKKTFKSAEFIEDSDDE